MALRASLSLFPKLMQGVYCCLRNFSFLFLPLTLLNSFDAHSLLSNYPHSSQFF